MSLEVRIVPFDQLTLDELYAFLKLRQDVFMLEQTCLFEDIDYRDQEAWHVLGKVEQQIVAYTRIFAPNHYFPDHSAIGRVVSSPQHRGRNYGREIMQTSIHFCATTWPTTPIKIGAQHYLERFYQSLGFVSTGPAYLEDDIPHLYMTQAL